MSFDPYTTHVVQETLMEVRKVEDIRKDKVS